MTTPSLESANVAQYAFEIDIHASCEHVWSVLTQQIGAWWLPDFHALGPDSKVHLEPHAGGRLYEKNDTGELLWYTIIAITPGDSMTLTGHVSPEWGGPCSTMLTLKLSAHEGGTRLSVSDALIGRVSEKLIGNLGSGWQQLFGDGLKRHAEAG